MSETISFGGGYVPRAVDHELDNLFPQLPAVLLDGPKGVGKTTTALQRSKTVRRLDIPAERVVVEADPDIVVDDPPPVLIDEWHRVPEVFDAIRRQVDRDHQGGRFLLTGSPPTKETHSGAGRIASLRMRPLALFERLSGSTYVSFQELLSGDADVSGRTDWGLRQYVDEIVKGGFPGMRGLGGAALETQLDSYLERIVDHDLLEAGLRVRRPELIRGWLRAYAAAVGTTASWETIRDAATPGTDSKPAKTTVQPYIEALRALRILDPIEGWNPTHSHLKALTFAPKHHLADPALAVRLVRLSATKLVQGRSPAVEVPRDGAYLGGLFESLAALSVRTLAQVYRGRTYHLRTKGGEHEVDLIVETDDGVIAFEVKLGAKVEDDDTAHLRWLRERIETDCIDLVVLNTGPEAFRRKDGVAVIPLVLLGV